HFLKPSIHEETDSPEIRKVVKKWDSFEKDEKKLEAALDFVHRHIKNKTYDHINLSAKEVLLKKSGDCTEHSTLLSALLKASEIPVKMVYGVVLGKNNKFMFHNWNEVYIDGNWIPVDATFGKIPADAARIAFVRSNGASSENEKVAFAVLGILNNLSIEVISYE
ncbi:MAG: transglutaminase-like domain-containing protein, partial [bacterium]